MNETMVYADGFEKTFATAEEMLDFLSRRGKPQSGSASPSVPSGWCRLKKRRTTWRTETQRWRRS